jgi:DNA-binding winged helix-turn-helix (wHTH) protein
MMQIGDGESRGRLSGKRTTRHEEPSALAYSDGSRPIVQMIEVRSQQTIASLFDDRYKAAMLGGDGSQSQQGENGRACAPIVLAHEPSFRIGDAAFHPATREVHFADKTSVIEPRVMQFLVALHRAGGAVVNKDDLLQSCWEGRIVGEDAINRVVSRLRGVAEKDAGQQFRIETITRVGYRLRSASGAAPATDGPPSPEPVADRRTAFSFRRPTALAAAASAI